ncbi:hypothetical protein B6C83_02030 [Aerococcus urinae]|nr:hypothetical protein B6C83_02030 [Aerococcus urinae]RAV67719.1 hypothetical protein DBT42_02025 [Aerococcus urinae]
MDHDRSFDGGLREISIVMFLEGEGEQVNIMSAFHKKMCHSCLKFGIIIWYCEEGAGGYELYLYFA